MKKILLMFSAFLIMLTSVNDLKAQHRHRKMSSQAKGALIGGGAGAIAGGLIGHGVGGALIGGAVGAGGGYVIGNEARRRKVKRERAYYRAHHTTYHRYAVRHH